MITYAAIPSPLFGYKQMFDAVELVDEAFAAGYFKDHLDKIDCAWIALDGDKVVGWAAVCKDDIFGMLRCVVVHPDYRRQGVGKRLTEERLKYLKDCDYVISYAWVRPNGECMSCKNLENFGFELAKELPEYYNNTRSKCKYCWSNCTCVARLYVRTQR